MEKKILLERHPYRFIDEGERGYIEKYNEDTKRWFNMYECDSRMQLLLAMEDFNYCKWLDPNGIPCYNTDVVSNPYD